MKQGKIGVETGVAALVDAINSGVIGKAAAAKYDIRDFTTDVGNSFTRMVQDIDLRPIEQGLLGISAVLGFVANRKDGVQGVFQTIVDWSGKAIEAAANFGLDVEIAFLDAQIAALPMIKVFHNVEDEIKSAIEWVGELGTSFLEIIPGMNAVIEKAHSLGGGGAHQVDAWDLIPGIGGLIEGARIRAAVDAKNMGIDLGEKTVEGTREGSHTHSPSDDMKDVGKDMSDGLGMGFSAKSVAQSIGHDMGSTGDSGGGHSFNFSMGDINAPHADATKWRGL